MHAVRELVDARDKLWMGTRLRRQFLPSPPEVTRLKASEDTTQEDLLTLQRSLARPYPYHFEIHRLEPKAEAAAPK